jgi:hypothetical protein
MKMKMKAKTDRPEYRKTSWQRETSEENVKEILHKLQKRQASATVRQTMLRK